MSHCLQQREKRKTVDEKRVLFNFVNAKHWINYVTCAMKMTTNDKRELLYVGEI